MCGSFLLVRVAIGSTGIGYGGRTAGESIKVISMATESVLHPSLIVPIGHVEPVPRRIRGTIGGRVAFDTRRALYVWEWQAYPQFSIPVKDLVEGVLHDDNHTEQLGAGPAHRHTL